MSEWTEKMLELAETRGSDPFFATVVRELLREAWGEGYAKAVRDAVPTTPTRDPGHPYSRPVVPVGGENAAPHDGGSTPPDDGAGPCQRSGCMSRLLDESFGATQ